jgi:hypothetical protein
MTASFFFYFSDFFFLFSDFFFTLEQYAFNLQADQVKELIEAVIRGKMRELDPKEMLLNEEDDVVISGAKSGRKKSSSTSVGHGLAGPSNTRSSSSTSVGHGLAGPSETGDSIEDAIIVSSDVSVKEEPDTRNDDKHRRKVHKDNRDHKKRRRSKSTESTELQSPKKVPKYLYTSDMDKDLLIALRVIAIFLYIIIL